MADPPISFFIFLIEIPGFMFTPPVSNVTPFPIMTNGLSFFESFRFVISITFGFEKEDLPTAHVKGKFEFISFSV